MRYVSLTGNGWASGKSSVMSTDFTAEQRKGMLLAVHEREGSWDKVDPDTEIKNIACDIGVSEDESYELSSTSWMKATLILGVSMAPGVRCQDIQAG